MANFNTIKAQMSKIPVNEHNGTQFYVHMFTVAPDLRKFFKGSESVTPAEVPTNERFRRQGQRILMSMQILVELAHNRPVFDAYMKDVMDKHKRFKGIDYALYEAFFGVWYGYLEKMTGMTPAEKAEWENLKDNFILPDVKAFMTGWNVGA